MSFTYNNVKFKQSKGIKVDRYIYSRTVVWVLTHLLRAVGVGVGLHNSSESLISILIWASLAINSLFLKQ